MLAVPLGKNKLKNPFIIYADLEWLLYPISTCDNTPNNYFTIRKNVHIPCGFSMLTSYAYDKSLNEHLMIVTMAKIAYLSFLKL